MVSATATQNGPIQKTAVKKPSSSSSTPSSTTTATKATKSLPANGYTKPALASASSKVKGLPAPSPVAAKPVAGGGVPAVSRAGASAGLPPLPAGKVRVAAESRPKAVGSIGAATPKPVAVGGVKTPAVGAVKAPSLPGAVGAGAGKVRISAESRPKVVKR